MAITVVSEGTISSKTTGASMSVGDLAAVVGDSLVAVVAEKDTGTTTVTYKPQGQPTVSLTKDIEIISVAHVRCSIWSIHNIIDNPGTGTVEYANSTNTAKNMAVYTVTGLATSATFDKSASSTGPSATPSSPQPATLAQTDEVLIGGIGTEGPDGDAAGTWNAGANQTTDNNQRLGTTGGNPASNTTVAATTKIVSATTGGIASKTGITSSKWAAAIATYKAAAADIPPGLGPNLDMDTMSQLGPVLWRY